MSSEIKQAAPPQEKKIYSEGRGQYTIINGTNVCYFQFPLTNKLEENLVEISFLRDQILTSLANQAKAAKEKAPSQEDSKPEATVSEE